MMTTMIIMIHADVSLMIPFIEHMSSGDEVLSDGGISVLEEEQVHLQTVASSTLFLSVVCLPVFVWREALPSL